jgi:hypothetical protein
MFGQLSNGARFDDFSQMRKSVRLSTFSKPSIDLIAFNYVILEYSACRFVHNLICGERAEWFVLRTNNPAIAEYTERCLSLLH